MQIEATLTKFEKKSNDYYNPKETLDMSGCSTLFSLQQKHRDPPIV